MDDNQPTMVTTVSGSKRWFLDGNYHREDGPAIIWATGDKAWYLNGKKHRTDGPAIEWEDGHTSWYLHGIQLSLDEWLNTNQTLTDEEKVMYKLQYG
jgi:hypothetical protein